MKKLVLWIKNNWNICLGTIIFCLLLLAYGFTNHFIQIFHYDMIEQYVRFIERGYDLIRTVGIEWWDFSHYLGSSVFAYGYYFLFSPFWLIFAALPSKDMIPQAMLFVNVFKLWVLFLSSTYYFSFLTKDKLANFLGSSILVFSGFILGYYQYGFYTDALVFLPIALVGVEKYLKKDKQTHLVLSIAMLAIVNVYLFMMFTAYIFLYTLFRYVVITEGFSLKAMVTKALKFFGYYLLGLSIAAVVFWPNIELLMQSSRTSLSLNGGMIDLKVFFRFITSWVMPVVDRNEFNPFISKFVSSAAGYSGGFALYSFIISPLLLPQIIFLKDLKHKITLVVFYGFLFIIVLFPSLYFLLQGNTDTRWMLMFNLLNAYSLVMLIENRKVLSFKLAFITAIIIGAILSLAYIYAIRNGFQLTQIYLDIAKRNIIVLAFIVFTYLIAFYFKSNDLIFKSVFILAVILEIILVLGNIFFNPLGSISMTPVDVESSGIYSEAVINKIMSIDDSAYRIDVFQDSGYNDPLSKDYMGLTFYSSVYNFELDGFIHNHLSSAGGWLVGNNKGKWLIKNLLASKYLVVDPRYNTYIPYGYQEMFRMEDYGVEYTVYENIFALPLGYTQSETFNLETYDQLNSLDQSRVLLNYVVTEDGTHDQVILQDGIKELGTFYTDYTVKFDEALNAQVIYVLFPRSEEVRVQFYDQGTLVKEFYSYEPQYVSAYCESYFDEIVVKVTNLYGVPEEEFVNTVYIQDPETFIQDWYSQKTADLFDIKLAVNSFTASGTSLKSQYFVTSIAYDDNWNIKVNGEKVKLEKVNAGFIGFRIPEGNVQIEASYFPIELIQGGFVSFLGVLYLSYLKIKKDKLT